MRTILRAFPREEDGQDLIEYSLLLGFVALAAMGIVGQAATEVRGIWSGANKTLVNANTVAS